MKPGRVLLVDDEVPHLETLRALLDDEFDVVTAGGIAPALDALDANDFHVVVSDFKMPGGTGLDVLRYARELDVIVSGFLLSGSPDDAAVAAAGQFRVVAKSTSPEALVDAVRAAVADVIGLRSSPAAAARRR